VPVLIEKENERRSLKISITLFSMFLCFNVFMFNVFMFNVFNVFTTDSKGFISH